MDRTPESARKTGFPVMRTWPAPAKALALCIMAMLGIGMAVAVGQVVIHDIVPTFSGAGHSPAVETDPAPAAQPRGDLFGDLVPVKPVAKPFFERDEFTFALKFTHIHVFGMSGIFIVVGLLVVFLDRSLRLRTWLIVLPFVGILLDLAGVWLKLFVHPVFFWLHVPGGLMFGTVFLIVAVLVAKELTA